MNYTSMQNLVNAGQSNMTTIVNYSDDYSSYCISSFFPSWFKVGNKTSSSPSAYFYSDSYLIINSMISIYYNQRNGLRQAIYYENGTVNGSKFFKLRFWGSSYWRYSASNSNYKIIYDIIFIENGDFMIYADTIPYSYFSGSFYINYNGTNTYYNQPSSSSKYISFVYNSSSNKFDISYKILDVKIPYEKKYILTNNDKNTLYYFNSSNSLVSVAASLTASNMKTYGFDLSTLQNNLSKISDFNGKLCYWVESNTAGETAYNKKLSLNGIPKPKFISTETIFLPNSFDINSISLDEKATDLMFLFNDTDSWMYLDTTGNWQTLDKELEGEGMLTSDFNRFKDKIEEKFKSYKTVKVRYRLNAADDYIANIQMLLK